MELWSHLGLVPYTNLTMAKFAYKCWAAFALASLYLLICGYLVVSFWASATAYVLPAPALALKAWATQLFWQCVSVFVQFNNVSFEILGDLPDKVSALVICNHLSLADYYFLRVLGSTASANVNFFTWYTLWRVPTPKVWGNMVCCDENWELSTLMCRSVFRKVLLSNSPEWIVIFPEVNIWSQMAAYLQRLQSQRYCLPFFDHVLYPRFSGLVNAVQTVGTTKEPKFETLYDVTVSYSPRPPSLIELFASSEKFSVSLHVAAIPLLRLPQRRAKLERWVERTWEGKDRRLRQLAGSNWENAS